jgi:hypothetical protein
VARDWQALVGSERFTAVMQLVHSYYRMTEADAARIVIEISKQKQQAYENELTKLASKAGCPSVGVADTYTLDSIKDQSEDEANGIVDTYNWDLAYAIINIHDNHPRANRNTYLNQLGGWNNSRASWKYVQIALHNSGEWQAQAQLDFTTYNDLTGWAELLPKKAAEPVCQRLAQRKRIPLREAQDYMSSWPPHLNCPHYWETHLGEIADCADMWLGANSGANVRQGGR